MRNNQPKKIDIADLHTPEDLLAGAESLLTSDDPLLMRAVVLEAISALETYVNRTVFGILDSKLDPLLVNWLKEKTKSNFDARLEVFTPVALGRSIHKKDELWNNYKVAKEIRNKITHSGSKVTRERAKFVVKTVYDWLAYLGSTAEVELSLLGLKKFVEREKIAISNEQEAASIVGAYFGNTKAAIVESEISYPFQAHNLKVDIKLRFGENTIIVETKYSPTQESFDIMYNSAIKQVNTYLNVSQIARGAIIIFSKGLLSESFSMVKTAEEGRISIVGIKV